MIINGIITPETRLSDLNSGWDADKTVADLIKFFIYGTCKYGDDEYVVITEPVLDNWGTNGEIDGVKTGGVAFYAQAIKLGDEYEHEHDTIYYPYTGNEYWCNVYELCWYVPDISADDDRYQMLLDYSEIVDWKNVDKVTLC